jgi:hypothetical protein
VRYFTKTVNQGTTPWIVSGAVTIPSPLPVTQSGVWSVGRTWTLDFSTDSVTVTGTVAATQSGAWTVAATQSGAWNVGRTWSLASGTDSVAAVQSGAWSIGINNYPIGFNCNNFPLTYSVTQGTTPWVTESHVFGFNIPGGVNVGVCSNDRTDFQLTNANCTQMLDTNASLFIRDVLTGDLNSLGALTQPPSRIWIAAAAPINKYAHINLAGAAAISPTPCVLHTLTINRFPATAMTITITDGLVNVAVITLPAFAQPTFWTPPVTLHYNVACSTSLTVTVATLGAFDLTVAFVT